MCRRRGYRAGRVGATMAPMGTHLHIEDTGRRRVEPRVLLFAGLHDQPRGGSADLVGWFDSEAEGRAAFLELRATTSDDEGWAELVVLGGGRRPRMLAWFGRRPSSARSHHPTGRGHLRLLVR